MSEMRTGDTLRSLLPAEAVIDDPAAIAGFCRFNPLFDAGTMPGFLARPRNADELQKLVRLANEEGLNLTAASSTGQRGKNGFSAANESVLLDLSRWKGIHGIDRRNRVCMVEPGVTYGELLPALASHGMTVPAPLAPREGKSVIAAVMDREVSTWPGVQWDAADPVASTEFIFGNGEVFRTGAAGGPGTLEEQRRAGGAQKSPLGPSQTDFHRVVQGSQGTMGIVTWITLRTEIKPSVQRPFMVGADNPELLAPFIYDVLGRRLGEHLFVLNRTAAAMLTGADGDNLPRYVCLLNIAGFERMPKERVKYQERDVRAFAKNNGFRIEESRGGLPADDLLSKATRVSGEADWRSRRGGRFLSVFFLCTLDRLGSFTGPVGELIAKYGLDSDEVGVYIQPVVQNHACHLEFIIPFDPGSGDADALRRLEKEMVALLGAAGAFYSRPYGSAGQMAFTRDPLNFEILKKVKNIFDPNRVLNRGKWGL